MGSQLKRLFLLLAAAAVLLFAWARYEDLRFPWTALSRFEKENIGCVAGIISPDYSGLAQSTGFISFFIAWGDPFPAEEIAKAGRTGAVLLLTWEPYLKKEPERSLLADIASGKYDSYIEKTANAMKIYGKPVLLRWGHEPNGDWYSWSGNKNGRDAGVYVKAWRRIAGITRKSGGKQVKLVFCVNGEDKPAEDWNRFENYYPGAEYADAVGLDVYNWGNEKEWSSWTRPNILLKDPYARVLELAPDKPIFLTEVASCPGGGYKTVWLKRLFYRLESRYTAVKGFLWFDYKKECDWRLTSEQSMVDVYIRKTRGDGYFSTDGKSLDWFFREGKDGN